MLRTFATALLLLTAVVATTSPAQAERTRERMRTPIVSPSSYLKGGCELGNTNPIDAAWSPVFQDDAFLVVIDPSSCPDCQVGFNLNSLTLPLFSAEECLVTVVPKLRSVDNSDPQCPMPGPVECVGDPQTIKLDGTGFQELELPIKCPCADTSFQYLLEVEFLDHGCDPENIGFFADSMQNRCSSYITYPDGGGDALDEGVEGTILLSASAGCCNNAVSTDTSTWGAIKGLFDR